METMFDIDVYKRQDYGFIIKLGVIQISLKLKVKDVLDVVNVLQYVQ